mmetsp:Transcript_7244/g.11419  ORF Transcript_7244/g.11419 Transcript_7244/m.11419 type:complete len:85 (-) Transcript_7244:1018-1272(-)
MVSEGECICTDRGRATIHIMITRGQGCPLKEDQLLPAVSLGVLAQQVGVRMPQLAVPVQWQQPRLEAPAGLPLRRYLMRLSTTE